MQYKIYKMKKLALVILDGWGLGKKDSSNAIENAKKPYMDYLMSSYPNSTLVTYGEQVGLPAGQMGNSEVGHLNIGAGRIVYQDLELINKAIKEKTIDNNLTVKNLFETVKTGKNNLHLIGLVSEGGVHSSLDHLIYLAKLAEENGCKKVFIHAITDGRDTDPKSGLAYLEKLENSLNGTNIKIASIIGRYFAMDRDKRWERVKKAYDLFVNTIGKKYSSAKEAILESYKNGVTDEFIEPILLTDENGNNFPAISEGDSVFCFNFRTDRCREITEVLSQKDFPEFGMKKLNLNYVTITNYDETYKNVKVVFDKENIYNTLGEVLSNSGKTQIRMAETEKYPHVTFFFSGGREDIFNGEKRIMAPSPKVATYDLQPQMSAPELKDKVVLEMNTQASDFICLNFANADMVGHTGVFSAIVKAIETVDNCLKEVVETGIKNGYSFIIIADHGNADYAVNQDGSPNTAHSKNPVPCILIDKDFKQIKNGKLADIAPSILKIMGIEIPKEMTGEVLVS
jgi:2,3-bisphosphoglycerate-independent phosphoglycerate mutase